MAKENEGQAADKAIEMAQAVVKLMPKDAVVGALDDAAKGIDEVHDQALEAVGDLANQGAKGAHEAVDKVAKQMKEGLAGALDGIENEQAKKMLQNVGDKAVDIGQQFADKAVDELKVQGSKALENLIGQMIETVKIVLGNVGALITGSKSKDEALEGIKGSWQEAGKNMEAAREQQGTKKTKLDEILEKGAKDNDKGFADKFKDQKNQDKGTDMGR